MPSISTRFSSSSTKTNFSEGLSLSMKPWFKIELEKENKSMFPNVVSAAPSPRFYFIHICFFSSVEKIVTKVNQITWLVN